MVVPALGVAGSASAAFTGQPPPPPSPFKIEKDRISFEPAACKEGTAVLHWALGSVRVKALGHKDGACLFELMNEIEQGYVVYLCKVPLAGPRVTIEMDKGKLKTSFDLAKCELLRTGNLWQDQQKDDLPFQQHNIEGTGFCNHFRDVAVGKGPAAEVGNKLKLQVAVYTGWGFDVPRVREKQVVETVLDEDAGKGVVAALRGVNVGTIRQVAIREEVTGKLFKQLVPDLVDNKQIFFEFKLLAVEKK